MTYALITGATSGIGESLAIHMAKMGHNLIIHGRSLDKLQALKTTLAAHGVDVQTVVADLSVANSAKTIAEFVAAQNLEVNILINNAGVGVHGNFNSNDLQPQLDMIQLNVAALVELSHLMLPHLLKHSDAKIMNVSSVAAFNPGPSMAVYFATKAFVLSFGEALAEELLGKVSVTTLCPGPTQSKFADNAKMVGKSIFSNQTSLPTSASVAEYGYSQMMRGRRISIHGWGNKFLATASRFVPYGLRAKLVKTFIK